MRLFWIALHCVYFAFAICPQSAFAQGSSEQFGRVATGKIKSPALQELSGMVASRVNKNCFWVHNDSGDDAKIYLIDSTAKLLCTYNLQGVSAVDFEEIAWFEKDGKHYLIVGDIGDNRAKRKHIKFHIFQEPTWKAGKSEGDIVDIVSISAIYPDGARDAEAFFVDPLTKQLILVSKRDFQAQVYTTNILANANFASNNINKPLMLKFETKLPLTFITAADISADGHHILVKNLTNIYYWKRATNSLVASLKKAYEEIPYKPEPQGEAITFSVDGETFYTISERPLGLESYLYRYQFLNK